MSGRVDWVLTASSPRIPYTPLSASLSVPMLLVIVWPRLWTLLVLIGVTAFLATLHMRGRNVPWLFRRFKASARGYRVVARPIWFMRRRSLLAPAHLLAPLK